MKKGVDRWTEVLVAPGLPAIPAETATYLGQYRNTAYFCPHCGEIWLRSVVLDQPLPWAIREALCSSCGPGLFLTWASLQRPCPTWWLIIQTATLNLSLLQERLE